MHSTLRRLTVALGLAAAITLIAVPAAGAVYVSGQQHLIEGGGAKTKMTGSLKGILKLTSFHVKHEGRVTKLKGTERFDGCVDVARDGSCDGDPSGTLRIRFRYWFVLEDEEHLLLGTCAHRVVESEGGLAGATGFFTMVDTSKPSAPSGVKTHYEGEIHLPGIGRTGHSDAPVGCVAP